MRLHNLPLLILLIVSILLLPSQTAAQITVSVNSGNPVMPFPQFMPYDNASGQLGNLATKLPDGVSHAEMEQVIGDAYQIMMNRAEKPGGGVDGVDYIRFNSTPNCTEGDGYALLAAVAMADKQTFDGLWLWVHDFRMNKVKRYSDCEDSSPGYAYSRLPGWTGAGANTAADGDFDIGLALLVAYLQWGEFMGIDDACGEPISYKKEAVEFLRALTDTIPYTINDNYVTGDIGLDGYIKGGDSWIELTGWANDITTSGFSILSEHKGPGQQHIDYAAPAYFRAFADFLALEDSTLYAWNIHQFRRAEASCDWLMGRILPDERMIPFAGWVELDEDNNATFSDFSDGEDFRMAWRTVLNSVWYGDPNYTWDPVTHQVEQNVPNTFQSDVGKRYARFLWDSRQSPWNHTCESCFSNDVPPIWGPDRIKHYYSPQGDPLGSFSLNWVLGTGSPSAVVAQDFDLMAHLYRNLEITWDATSGGKYLTSVPHYFHGWFRLLGMLTLTGNYQRPSEIKPTANMKVYLDVNKTRAANDEEISYTISYRNYGTLDAENVKIIDTLDHGLRYLSSSGGTFDAASRAVTWYIGTVPGFTTEGGISQTTGSVSLNVEIAQTDKKQFRNTAYISCGNGAGWKSSEYPNTVSTRMRRNFVDVTDYAGDDQDIKVSPLHGGRSGIRFTCFSSDTAAVSPTRTLTFRLFHDAEEAYVNHGNYRVSYFLYDTLRSGIVGRNGNEDGWKVEPIIREGIENVKISHQDLAPGANSRGKWNQRIIVQFSESSPPDTIGHTAAATTWHLEWYRGIEGMIHRGGTVPLRVQFSISTADLSSTRWDDDWSWNSPFADDNTFVGYPISPDFTSPAPENAGIPVDGVHPKSCETADLIVDNILVEEWDGYTWRRVFGTAPQQPVAASNEQVQLRKQPALKPVSHTLINYTIPHSAHTRVQVLNMQGKVVATLIDSFKEEGTYKLRWNGGKLGSSMYLIRLVSGNISLVKSFIKLR